MRVFYLWCLDKVRSIIGTISFMIPRIYKQTKKSVRLVLVFMTMFLLMCPLIFRPTMYASSFGSNDFTYTGQSEWVSDGGLNFRLRFLTSGIFTPKKNVKIDLFIVGAGGGGGASPDSVGRGGGGGGYTGSWSSINVTAGTAYSIVIGAGGSANSSGGASSAFGYSRNGGVGDLSKSGQNGGSGGGMAGNSTSKNGSNGGSNGSNGASNNQYTVGVGQGSTTREFGEASGALYGGGGGGGAYDSSGAVGGAGGDGGGGKGGNKGQTGTSGIANTGGGGGGGGGYNSSGWGGSGIVIIRDHRGL